MQNWEYTFPPTSKESWIQQVEKDLKGKPVESLTSEWWPGEPLIPFHYSGETEPVILPDFLFKDSPKITEEIDFNGKSIGQINRILREALQFGTQTFLVTKEDAVAEFEGLLDGIFPEMINWHFYAHEKTGELYRKVVNLTPRTTFFRIIRTGSKDDLRSALNQYEIDLTDIPNIKLEYQFSSDGNWIDEAAKVFQLIIKDWRQWRDISQTTSFADQCVLSIDLGDYYFKHLIQVRVMHLLWLNFTKKHMSQSNELSNYLECHITPKSKETPEKYLIRASMSSLAAFLTGAYALCIHHPETSSSKDFYRRIDLNLHHLLHLESGLPSGKDPLAGAYSIDYYTRSWTQRIWDKIS